MTRKEKADILLQDFLGRNGEHFTLSTASGRLGWEKALSSGAAYSSAMLSPPSDADLHRIAYDHARDMVVAMNTPFRVRIALTPGSSYTDSRTLAVATDMFDDPALSVGQKIDIFTGLAVHEGSHLLYTDFTLLPLCRNRVIADLMNIIEDERIEMLTARERPGLANFLACTKYYYFGRHCGRTVGKLDRPQRLLNAILSMIRYPRALDPGDVEELADTLWEVRSVIIPYPSTCREALEAAGKIFDIIREFFERERSGKGGAAMPGGPSGRAVEEALGKVLDSIEQDVTGTPSDGSGSGSLRTERMSAAVRKEGCRLGRSLSGQLEIGATEGVNVLFPRSNREEYERSLQRVRRWVPAMASVLRGNGSDRCLDLRGLRSGLLDTCKLAEAVQGVENVYRREQTVRADRMAVCVLVDESGSMSGEKIQAARDTAVLLNEALSSVRNVDLYIYGHTTDDFFVKLRAYREGNASGEKYALGAISADWSNVDSKAIREAAARVRARTAGKCLFFVISDGAPCESPANVRRAVRELSREGFSFVSIGIDFQYDPSQMYEHHVSLTDMSRLAPELGKMIRKAIVENTKRQQS